ncbi:hypothetical protein O6H91_11G076100 [Diphasiastrum complanatum]|uniref:Uncharacterized protein n=1 Tax=Diphasiastrum complanatum TaxID=34168 RepID=A0ACC2CAQ4_DIPCM|nr:hypothetical protein O6H91_11G076100 [Diphasiastrum complanatum]
MPPYKTEIECTAYCSCGYCCSWEWGVKMPGPFYLGLSPTWLPIRLRNRRKGYVNAAVPILSRYWTSTSLIGSPYFGLTSIGKFPAQVRPPIFSKLSLMQYQKLPGRLLLPWRLLPVYGSIAADTNYYPFGTRMFVPGYGWGEQVEDRGSAIKGPSRIDLYHRSHKEALKWGRRKLQVLVVLPGQSFLDLLRVPKPLKSFLKTLNFLRSILF